MKAFMGLIYSAPFCCNNSKGIKWDSLILNKILQMIKNNNIMLFLKG